MAHNGQQGKETPQTCWVLLRMFINPTFLIVRGISQKSAVFSATDPPLPRLVHAFCAIV